MVVEATHSSTKERTRRSGTASLPEYAGLYIFAALVGHCGERGGRAVAAELRLDQEHCDVTRWWINRYELFSAGNSTLATFCTRADDEVDRADHRQLVHCDGQN